MVFLYFLLQTNCILCGRFVGVVKRQLDKFIDEKMREKKTQKYVQDVTCFKDTRNE
jgi:hypothetical protein